MEATAAHGSRSPELGSFRQSSRCLAAAATAAHGLRHRRGAAGRATASNALIAEFRRDSARRS
jgi:hypothetical protein